MINQCARERLQLPEHTTDAISRSIADAVDAERIKSVGQLHPTMKKDVDFTPRGYRY
jgi:hypothetical protein